MNSWQRLRDELVRRVLGFSPFEVEDDVRRLHALVDRMRDEQAREVERLRAEIRRLGGGAAPERATDGAAAPPNGGKRRLPVA